MKWWHRLIGLVAVALWLFVVGPRIGTRPFLVFFGGMLVVLSVAKGTRIAPLHSGGRGGHPAAKPERIVMFIVGGAFVAAGAFGWIHGDLVAPGTGIVLAVIGIVFFAVIDWLLGEATGENQD